MANTHEKTGKTQILRKIEITKRETHGKFGKQYQKFKILHGLNSRTEMIEENSKPEDRTR